MPIIKLSNHIFLACRTFSSDYEPVVVIADNKEEAQRIGMKYFGFYNNDRLVTVQRLKPTEVNMGDGEIKRVFAVTYETE